jgi:hypothetical protein
LRKSDKSDKSDKSATDISATDISATDTTDKSATDRLEISIHTSAAVTAESNYRSNSALFSDLVNIETQPGSNNAFSYVGNMRNSTDNSIVRLFGRYLRRGEYEYYAQLEDIRTPLVTTNREQLNDGDKINIPLFSDSPFTVYLHRNNYYMYNPYNYR